MWSYRNWEIHKSNESPIPISPCRSFTAEQIANINATRSSMNSMATSPTSDALYSLVADEQKPPPFIFVRQPATKPTNYPPCVKCNGPTSKYVRKNGKRYFRCKSGTCGYTWTEEPKEAK